MLQVTVLSVTRMTTPLREALELRYLCTGGYIKDRDGCRSEKVNQLTDVRKREEGDVG